MVAWAVTTKPTIATLTVRNPEARQEDRVRLLGSTAGLCFCSSMDWSTVAICL